VKKKEAAKRGHGETTTSPTRPFTDSPTQSSLLGAHMSIAGGVDKAIFQGQEVGCEAIQIFTKSSRQWVSKPLSEEEIANFHNAKKTTGLTTVVAHDSYLYNFAATDDALRKKSVNGLIDEMERCEALGIAYLLNPVLEALVRRGVGRAVGGPGCG